MYWWLNTQPTMKGWTSSTSGMSCPSQNQPTQATPLLLKPLVLTVWAWVGPKHLVVGVRAGYFGLAMTEHSQLMHSSGLWCLMLVSQMPIFNLGMHLVSLLAYTHIKSSPWCPTRTTHQAADICIPLGKTRTGPAHSTPSKQFEVGWYCS